jgi:hypothetical protein
MGEKVFQAETVIRRDISAASPSSSSHSCLPPSTKCEVPTTVQTPVFPRVGNRFLRFFFSGGKISKEEMSKHFEYLLLLRVTSGVATYATCNRLLLGWFRHRRLKSLPLDSFLAFWFFSYTISEYLKPVPLVKL